MCEWLYQSLHASCYLFLIIYYVLLSNDISEEPNTGLVNLSSMNYKTNQMNMYIQFCEWLYQSWHAPCIIFVKNIPLVLSNDDSEDQDTDIVHVSSINHIIKEMNTCIHLCSQVYKSRHVSFSVFVCNNH